MLSIVISGIFIRLVYFLKPRSFWGDEWFTIFLSQKSLKDAFISAINDVHPPFQFIVYHFTPFCYRLLPFIAGSLSLYFFAKLSKDKMATFLFAISPYFIHLSGEVRGYGFLCLFSILALLGCRWAFPLALFTEHYAWFLLLAIPFALWFIPFLIASAAIIIHQTGIEQVFASERLAISLLNVVKKAVGVFLHFGGGIQYSFLTLKQAVLIARKNWHLIFFLLPIIFLFFTRSKRYLRLLFVPVLFLLLFYPVRLSARYLPFCAVAYFLLIGEGFNKLRLKKPLVANLIMASFIIANVFALVSLIKTGCDPYHKEDYIEAAKFIKENLKDSDGLIGYREQVKYYLKRDFPENGRIIWEVYMGNPDMEINYKSWRERERKLNKKLTLQKQFSELVWVLKYE